MNLRALRDIGEDRAREQAEQARLRDEQARLVFEEAERLRRADAERIVREAEAVRQRQADEQARQEREAQLRLAEAERCARIDAQTRLEEARLRLEIEARAAHGGDRRPVGLMLVLLSLLLGAGGLGVYFQRSNARALAARRAAQQRIDELQAVNADIQKKQDELARANEARRAELEAEIRRLETRKDTLSAKGGGQVDTRPRPPRPTPRPPAEPGVHIKMCPKGKPMCQEWERQ